MAGKQEVLVLMEGVVKAQEGPLFSQGSVGGSRGIKNKEHVW